MKKYDISEEFGIFRNIKPPFNKFLFPIAEFILADNCKELKSDENLKIVKEQIKTDDDSIIDLYIYEPLNFETDKVLLYIHGGAFVYEGNSTHFKLCRRYALEGGCKVIYVDYRRVPKYIYPTPIKDCFSAYKWVIENADKLRIDVHKIILGGDSAGACLSVDTVLKAHNDGIILPCFQVLIYPVLDKRMETESMKKYVDTPMWNAKLNNKMWNYYLCKKEYISPNEMKDLSWFPNTYIETAEFDCLHDEGIIFANKLRDSNIEVELNETKQTMHGFDMFDCEITEKAVLKRIEVLRKID